jgi:hypothetical protein
MIILASSITTKSNLFCANFVANVFIETALYRLLTIQVPNFLQLQNILRVATYIFVVHMYRAGISGITCDTVFAFIGMGVFSSTPHNISVEHKSSGPNTLAEKYASSGTRKYRVILNECRGFHGL